MTRKPALHVDFGEEPGLVVALGDRPVIERGAGWKGLSAGWGDGTGDEQILVWLEHFAPENGHREHFMHRARKRWREAGLTPGELTTAKGLWGNTDWEYTGAARISREAVHERKEEEGRYVALSEELVGLWLKVNARRADDGAGQQFREKLREHGLSGGRGKIALRWNADARRWEAGSGRKLSTHVLKNESGRSWLPAEAGIESYCQHALGLAGVPVCETHARVYAGVQTVVSRRGDRRTDRQGRVTAVHQEEWSQAAGVWPDEKSDPDIGEGWDELLKLLHEKGADPGHDVAAGIRFIAANVLIANLDVHRRNVGVRHVPGHEGGKIVLAPAYDVSSADGVAHMAACGLQMVLPIGGVHECGEVTGQHWRRLAWRTEAPTGLVLDCVREVAERLPDALADAHRQCRVHDEVTNEGARDERVDTIRKGTGERCGRILRELGTGRRRERVRAAGATG